MKCLILLLLLCCGNHSGNFSVGRDCTPDGCCSNRCDGGNCGDNRYENDRCDNNRCDNDRCDNHVRPEPRFEHRSFGNYGGSTCGCEEVRKNDDCGCNA